jgi:hypothetical protein
MNHLGLQCIYAWKYHKGTLCVAIFISSNQKCYAFLFFFFSCTKSESRNKSCVGAGGGISTDGRGKIVGKGGRRVNTVKRCVHMHVNAKLYHLKLFQEWGKGDKGEQWSGFIQV